MDKVGACNNMAIASFVIPVISLSPPHRPYPRTSVHWEDDPRQVDGPQGSQCRPNRDETNDECSNNTLPNLLPPQNKIAVQLACIPDFKVAVYSVVLPSSTMLVCYTGASRHGTEIVK